MIEGEFERGSHRYSALVEVHPVAAGVVPDRGAESLASPVPPWELRCEATQLELGQGDRRLHISVSESPIETGSRPFFENRPFGENVQRRDDGNWRRSHRC